ncbi:lysine exporter LysO family protein [Fusobacterium nucleatum]|uniref:lysine exporter LysO family protein n=1 Tax=Fusobacterium nucleatum TaxID=851 RepID=UPI0003B88B35|nr:lysine exporter LysO family protein [Fusobacterium nucleatum]ERT43257.1 hypothetical protein HMPREF1539_01031 [Fusobacterium nucleatum CTI-2]
MTILPFICLGIGIILGLFIKEKKIIGYSEKISSVALALLMITIGLNIGIDKAIMKNFFKIGFNCIGISLLAIIFSVIFTFICEKTILPLKQIKEELERKDIDILSEKTVENSESSESNSWFVWMMPISVIIGLLLGILLEEKISPLIINNSFTLFLIILYICVGISQGTNRKIFSFLKLLGIRLIWLSIAILIGSIVGGMIAGIILKIPWKISVISASGMSYYSITGAFMVNTYGIEIGTYGFIVNIMRELFTIVFMPFLIKISPGSPIAGGAAGNMDTMLMPVTKFVGVHLGLVTLLTGTILTFIVPFLLPLLASIL